MGKREGGGEGPGNEEAEEFIEEEGVSLGYLEEKELCVAGMICRQDTRKKRAQH